MGGRGLPGAKPNPSLKVMGRRLRSSIQLLSAVASISALPVRVRDLSQAAEEILTTLVQELEEVDSCSLLLYEPQEESLTLVAASGQNDLLGEPREGYNKDLRFAPGEGVAGQVFVNNSPRFWNRGPTGTELAPVNSAATMPESLACMPLTASAERIGVLNVSFVRSKPFDFHRRRDLLLLAGVAANVIQSFLLRLEVTKYVNLLQQQQQEQPAEPLAIQARSESGARNGDQKLDLVIQSCPTPVLAWQKAGPDFVLTDFNPAGRVLVESQVGRAERVVASEARGLGLALLPNMDRCYQDQSSFTEEVTFQTGEGAREKRFLSSYAYVPPDRVYSFFIDLGKNGLPHRQPSQDEEELAEMVQRRVAKLELANRDLVNRIADKDQLIDSLRAETAAERRLAEDHNLRMKKNLEVVTSLLNLISARADNDYVTAVLGESQRQVISVALLYETIRRAGDEFVVDLHGYLTKLAAKLRSMYVAEDQYLDIKIRCKDLRLPVKKAVPVCLVISELASNAVRHAFPGGQKGEILIRAESPAEGEYELDVNDNGVGFAGEVDLNSVESPGLALAVGLVRNQLGGTINLDQTSGTAFHVKFRL